MDSSQLFASRFKSARLMKGFSLQDLAHAIGGQLTRQALYKYEKGEVIPNDEILGKLSHAMGVNKEFFFREMKIKLSDIDFRAQKKIPQKEVNRTIEKTGEYLSRYIELKEILGINDDFTNPLEDLEAVDAFFQISDAAKMLRERWNLGMGAIPNIANLLEEKFITVMRLETSGDSDGLHIIVNKNIPVIVFNASNNQKSDRIRLTLLYELALLLLKFNKVSQKQQEVLCRQFAGMVLLPEETLRIELGNHRNKIHIRELVNLKKQYGIPMQSVIMQAKDSGIINAHYAQQLLFMFKQMSWNISEPFDYDGKEESSRFDQLLLRALAEGLISMSKAASLKNQSLAEFKDQYQPAYS